MSIHFRCILALVVLAPMCAVYGQPPDLSSMDIVMRSLPPGPVAFIDGEPIPHEDFERLYRTRIAAMEARTGEAPDDNTRVGMAIRCLSELAQEAFLAAEADRRNIHVSDYEVSKAYEAELKRLGELGAGPGETPLNEAAVLAKTGQSKAEARAAIERRLRMQKAADALLAEEKIEISDAEVRKFYENNQDRFAGPAGIHVKQILIKPSPTPRNATEEQWEDARKRIEKALARVRAGERFEAVAKEVSDAPDAERGGDMGVLSVSEGRGGAPPFLVEAVAGLKPGGLSGLVRSEFGYHIFKLVDRTSAGGASYEAAAPQIRSFLEAARGEQALESIIQPILQDPSRVRIYLQLPKSLAAKLKSGESGQ